MTLISDYSRIAGDLPRTIGRIERQPEVAREIEHYRNNIGKIKSVGDFMANSRVYEFALRSFGLDDMIYAKALVRKVLTEGVDSPDAFSVRLADQRFREFASVFNFKRYGAATVAFDRAQQGTIDQYLRNTLEKQSGQQSEALRLALYFERKAENLQGPFSVLADRAILQVVQTALGLPEAMSAADIDKQASLLSERLDVSKFADAGYTRRFINRFLARSESAAGAVQVQPALQVLGSGGRGMDMNTLLSIQTLRKFGA
jgi:hypothetical protein